MATINKEEQDAIVAKIMDQLKGDAAKEKQAETNPEKEDLEKQIPKEANNVFTKEDLDKTIAEAIAKALKENKPEEAKQKATVKPAEQKTTEDPRMEANSDGLTPLKAFGLEDK